MSESVPNHICKACGKAYYACPDCDRVNSWKSMACSPQCYQKYMQMVLEARTPADMQKDEPPEEEKMNDDFLPLDGSDKSYRKQKQD